MTKQAAKAYAEMQRDVNLDRAYTMLDGEIKRVRGCWECRAIVFMFGMACGLVCALFLSWFVC